MKKLILTLCVLSTTSTWATTQDSNLWNRWSDALKTTKEIGLYNTTFASELIKDTRKKILTNDPHQIDEALTSVTNTLQFYRKRSEASSATRALLWLVEKDVASIHSKIKTEGLAEHRSELLSKIDFYQTNVTRLKNNF